MALVGGKIQIRTIYHLRKFEERGKEDEENSKICGDSNDSFISYIIDTK